MTFWILAFLLFSEVPGNPQIVKETKKITFEEFPEAFNPSLIPYKDGYLLSFRYCPDSLFNPHISHIGIVQLDAACNPLSKPQLLNTRFIKNEIPSQSEDARLFWHRDRILVIFNDNPKIEAPSLSDRRDIYIAELLCKQEQFYLTPPFKLSHPQRALFQVWEKNWVPFEWDQTLFFAYSISPHEILQPNFFDGDCFCSFSTETSLLWNYGIPRGGTPALFIDGEYLSFFHSSVTIPPTNPADLSTWFYLMGAYTFSPTPPFQITKMTPIPIFNEGFYDLEFYSKRVIFPGGFVDAGSLLYLAYGRNDCEIWIATLDKQALKEALFPLR